MIKITGGKYNRKKLETISKFVRPTSALKRQAIFSIAESYAYKNSFNFYEEKIFLDLFAGIGTMGLEAISRGMKNVIFYENNEDVIKILKKNCESLCKNEQYKIINEDVFTSKININFDNISIIYVDPPYQKYNIDNLLVILQNKLNERGIIIIETSINDKFLIPKKLKLINKKKYGKTNISFLILS